MNIKIVKFDKKQAKDVTSLIRSTYLKFNAEDAQKSFTNFYLDYHDFAKDLQQFIKRMEKKEINLVALDKNQVIGVIMGTKSRMASFFVQKKYQSQGIGSQLLSRYETKAKRLGSGIIKLNASSFAVSFYQKNGYIKTTGIRNIKGKGILAQPMKKVF